MQLDGLKKLEQQAMATVKADFELARNAEDPRPEDLFTHAFAPTPVTEEKGEREPADRDANDRWILAVRQ